MGEPARGLVLALAICLGLTGTEAMAAPEIGQIRARLYYEKTGRLSEDIAPPSDFAAWNIIIGGGSAEEPANDLLVEVEVLTGTAPGPNLPLTITATAGGRTIARRTIVSTLVEANGRSWHPILLPNIGCAGRLRVVATLGKASKTLDLAFPCGE